MPNIQKIESEMTRLISVIFQRELKDKTISFVTVTEVKVLKDLSTATIYYTVLGQDAKKEAVRKSLIKAKGFIRSTIAKKMKLRKVPDLVFEYDKSLEYGNKIDDILKQL
ncbi:30S ribosome-binding factor RbfA [Mycoplasmatota bacterium]|nr:30S ribosome-binding factor RbfA [Mycoplasmatota bacterium]